jgi:hypothetical protein
MDKLNSVHQEDANKAPQIVFVMNGTFHIPVTKNIYDLDQNYVTIGYPIMIIGGGQEKTAIHGGFHIKGKDENGKRVGLKDITVKGSSGCAGLLAYNGLSFLCTRMTFTQCARHGLLAWNTKGRLINCVVTQCKGSGIYCSANALIELEGDQTKVDGNGTSGYSSYYGLTTTSTSSIHLLFPLTKEYVSTNNHNGRNYGGFGTIETVAAFNTSSSIAN